MGQPWVYVTNGGADVGEGGMDMVDGGSDMANGGVRWMLVAMGWM